jgi:hypothetical protein
MRALGDTFVLIRDASAEHDTTGGNQPREATLDGRYEMGQGP